MTKNIFSTPVENINKNPEFESSMVESKGKAYQTPKFVKLGAVQHMTKGGDPGLLLDGLLRQPS